MMTDANDIYKAIQERIHLERERIDKWIDKLRYDTTKDKAKIERNKKSIENYRKELRYLDPFGRAISDLYHFTDDKFFSFPDETIADFKAIVPYLDEKEIEAFRKTVNGCLDKGYEAAIKTLHEKTKVANDTLKKSCLRGRKVTFENNLLDIDYLIDKAEKLKHMRQRPSRFYLFDSDKEKPKFEFNAKDEWYFTTMKELVSKADKKDELLSKVNSDFYYLKNLFVKDRELTHFDDLIRDIEIDLAPVHQINVTPIKEFLNKLKLKNKKELDKIRKEIGKYDIKALDEKINEYAQKKNEEESRKSVHEHFKYLAYEYRRLRENNPNNRIDIDKIYAEMQAYAIANNISEIDQNALIREADSKYYNEKFSKNLEEAEKEKETIRASVNPEKKRKANKVYREYLRYKSRLKDKEVCLTFHQYAKAFYFENDMTIDMVDNEVKGLGK